MANMILNPGFETQSGTQPANWVTYAASGNIPTFLYSSTTGRNNTFGVGITYNTQIINTNANWEQRLPTNSIDPTKTYYLSGYLSTNNIVTTLTGWAGATIYVAWQDVNGGYLAASHVSPSDAGSCNNGTCFITGTNGWSTIPFGSIVKPAIGAVNATVAIGIANCSGTAYFDDIFFDLYSTCPVINPGFTIL